MKFLKPGILTSLQDYGRYGLQSKGINPCGVMDRSAFRKINLLLQNNENEAVLEFHFPAPKIQFEEHTSFVLGGADFDAYLNFIPLSLYVVFDAEPGDVLEFRSKKSGERGYLGIKCGFKVPSIQNSKSTHLIAGFGGVHIKNNSILSINGNEFCPKIPHLNLSINKRKRNFECIHIVVGPEFDQLNESSQNDLLMNVFLISNQSNRMGYRLIGPTLSRIDNKDILSSSVEFGTIQLLPSGQLICLMADSQTTGGYPRIAKVIESDLSLLAQMGPNSSFTFELISFDEAEALFLKRESYFRKLKISYKLALDNAKNT